MAKPKTHIVVIGAGYAGLLTTVRLAGKTRRANVAITLVNASEVFVERMRLHQIATNQVITGRPIRDTLRGTGVTFVQGIVTGVDLNQRTITVRTPSEDEQIGYDKLVYALGSTIDRDALPGLRDHAYTLTPSGDHSAEALRPVLARLPTGARVLIGGGGATGIESAAEFADAYPNLQVRLVTRGSLGMFLGKDVADYVRKSLERRNVTIQDHTTITRVEAGQMITSAGDSIPFDVCLWAGGFAVPALAREAGLKVNERGQILVDPFLRSVSHPDVYAVGDSAQPIEDPGVRVRMSAFTAVILGAHGADSLAAAIKGKTPKPLSFAYLGQGIGLGRGDTIGFNNYPADIPRAPYFTGRAGYEVREFFVRFLASLPAIERRAPGFFYWLGRRRYAAALRAQSKGRTLEQPTGAK